MKIFVTFFVLLLQMSSLPANIFDLNDWEEDFVLETKKIEIPGHPEAFNPSIVKWQEKLLMSFRTYDSLSRSTDAIGLIWLDENFIPQGQPTFLEREGEIAPDVSKAQDPRLIVVNDDLYIIYSNLYPYEEPVSRMVVGKVQVLDEGRFKVSFPSPLLHFSGEIRDRKEKNWVPFAYENNLMLAYSLQPHTIFSPILDMNGCGVVSSTIGDMKWKFGTLRGGTPALKIDDFYLGFFHSDKALASKQSGGKMMNHYFMGAYTFESEYPFAIRAISPHPIVAKSFYEGPMYNTWKPLRVVFPCGFFVDENAIWVSYGRQDHEIWVVKLDKSKLLASLISVNSTRRF